jgi:hypothetical protein
MIRSILSAALTLLLASPAAPAAPTAKAPDEMAALRFLVGEWKGKGWVAFRPGKREHFTSSEKVRSKLNGHILVIEGTHKDSRGKVVHQALGVLSYDAVRKALRFSSYLANGRSGVYQASYAKGTLTWSIKTSRMTMRYRIRLDKRGRWSEIGEMSRDGKSWRKFFEMTLARARVR